MIKPYTELTRLGQIRRLRQVVEKALEDYDLHVAWFRFFAIETNTMFEVRSAEGVRAMLRIYSDEETTLAENQAEMFWLDAIKRDTDIKVTEPIARRDGGTITVVTVPGVPAERRCALFGWIPGRTLYEDLRPENYVKLGQTLAKLHNHAETLRPLPSQIQPKRWDKVFYYPDEPVVYDTPAYSHLFSPARVDLLQRVIAQADELFARLFADEKDLMLIHGDLHYWNVHCHRGELYLLDFEDVNLGYPVQDIAVTLYYGRERDDYVELRAAFTEGYRSARAWPDEGERTIATLMAARMVMFINYMARIDPSPEAFIERLSQDLARYLDRYGS